MILVMEEKGHGLGDIRARFGFLLCYLRAMCPWASHSVFLNFSFLTGQWKIIIPLHYSMKIKMINCWQNTICSPIHTGSLLVPTLELGR